MQPTRSEGRTEIPGVEPSETVCRADVGGLVTREGDPAMMNERQREERTTENHTEPAGDPAPRPQSALTVRLRRRNRSAHLLSIVAHSGSGWALEGPLR